MKITVYTVNDCQFSKQEREYLNTNKLQYEEKNLEMNKDFLTEMLAISNNFAGTPVTRVEKDDGTITVLKGFTKEEFDTTFGFTAAPADNQKSAATPSAGSGQVSDTPIATPPAAGAPADTTTPPPASTTTPDPLKSVMNDLQTKSQPTEVQPTPPAEQLPATAPTIPNFPASDAKTVV